MSKMTANPALDILIALQDRYSHFDETGVECNAEFANLKARARALVEESAPPADPFAGDLGIRVKVVMTAYITLGMTSSEINEDSLWEAVKAQTLAQIEICRNADSMDSLIDRYTLESISDTNDVEIKAPVPAHILAAFERGDL